MTIPGELKYSEEHEWVRLEGDVATIGITEHAQESLGDIVFIEMPEVGREISKGEACGVVESVKAVSDLFAPITGAVKEVNEALVDAPETVNKDPYGEGWMVQITPASPEELSGLLDADGYRALLEKEAK